MTDKQLAFKLLESLPETASLSDIREELDILEAIKEGQADIKAGRYKTVDEAKQLLSSWVGK